MLSFTEQTSQTANYMVDCAKRDNYFHKQATQCWQSKQFLLQQFFFLRAFKLK